jgi:aspartate aminotransferase-like enzyme
MPFRFKIASEPHELEQIHELNYRTFVEEIPQHQAGEGGRLVDRFHEQNVYVIALKSERLGETLAGMLAIREQRPFSLDGKLPDLERYLPPGRRPCEIRLLAIAKEYRSGAVLPGLLAVLWERARSQQFDCAVISATTRQLKLYGRLGFTPFGPLVGTAEAPFQPMLITLESFREHSAVLPALPPSARGELVNLLPGPVTPHPEVVAAFQDAPRSHRSSGFLEEMEALRASLKALTAARHVAVLLGSGTLANDVIAGQLASLPGKGVVFSNGEFGERLADHAARMGLGHEHVRVPWAEPIGQGRVEEALASDPSWVWLTVCETSTGVLNDVASIAALCAARGTKLCLDAVSAIGAVPLDLSHVFLASGASGKALAGYPGLSLVFHEQEPAPAARSLPRYLDLALYTAGGSVPFTHSSNLVSALRVALERVLWSHRHAEIARLGAWLRRQLRDAGVTLIGEEAIPAPHVITIALPEEVVAADVARALQSAGFLIAHASPYLAARNWIQISTMGEVSRDALAVCVRELVRMGSGSATRA